MFHLKQSSAIEACPPDKLVWAEDYPGKRTKKYIVASPAEFYEWTRNVSSLRRHYYEVLKLGPCHMYFDIDASNEEGVETVDREVRRLFAIMYDETDPKLVEMDSSRPGRFSRHLVYRCERAFENNFHCGAFARRIVASSPEIAKEKIIDLGVYTSNRCFRCAGSSKGIAPEYAFLPMSWCRKGLSFFDTLVQAQNPSSDLLECMEIDGSVPRSTSKNLSLATTTTNNKEMPNSFGDALAEEISTFWNGDPVRYHSYDGESKTMLFSSESRYCGLMRAEHEHNHVFFVANVRKGAWKQGCHSKKRDCCCEIGEGGKIRTRWSQWRSFRRAEDVRKFYETAERFSDVDVFSDGGKI